MPTIVPCMANIGKVFLNVQCTCPTRGATERPCPFCGALFKSHLCPVWVQVTVLLLFGVAAPPDESQPEATNPGLRCEVCLASFETLASLTEHLQSEHALQGMAFNVARDSVAGSPACAHCGIFIRQLVQSSFTHKPGQMFCNSGRTQQPSPCQPDQTGCRPVLRAK